MLATAPERSIAVFKLPRDNSTDYIKRVIGLPGDEIQMRHGVLYINGKEVPKRRVGTSSRARTTGLLVASRATRRRCPTA